MPLPEKDEMFLTKGKMRQEIIVSLGGRVAEELIFEDITTGASGDIKQATNIARAMVTKYGFTSALGLVNYDNEDSEVFIGAEIGHTHTYSNEVADKIDEEVKRIIDSCYEEAKRIISSHMDVLHASAKLLMEKERIGMDEFNALFDA